MEDPACVIGEGIQVRGEVQGSGDLVVEGRLEGHVTLEDHLMVEQSGAVMADVDIREMSVHGQMSGNIEASERVSISSTALVIGDITTPRLVIEDGARFRGTVIMDVPLPDDI